MRREGGVEVEGVEDLGVLKGRQGMGGGNRGKIKDGMA